MFRRSVRVQTSAISLLPILIAIALSNHTVGTILSVASFFALFFFPGYWLMSLAGEFATDLKMLGGAVFGVVTITTLYDILAQLSAGTLALYLAMALAVASIIEVARRTRRIGRTLTSEREFQEMAIAGCVVAVGVASVAWRSGRFSDGEFVFYGPAGQDSLFHVTLVQRLMRHVPPDNFMASGLQAPIYHYLNDLSVALIWRFQQMLHLSRVDLFDLYYRSYPTLTYFLLGALAYRVGKRLLGTWRAGILGLVLLLGGGGLGWVLGGLRTAVHTAQSAEAAREALFSDWTALDGMDSILPLLHRPAYYDGLLICLAALNILLLEKRTRRNWAVAGLMLGLMAGFNFTLCATLGLATLIAAVVEVIRGRQEGSCDLAWLALFIFLGSLPMSGVMLLSGFHYPLATEPFHLPSLNFPTAVWGSLLERGGVPQALLPWVALCVFPVLLLGVKLFGIGAMARFDLGEERHQAIATVLATAFVISFVIGLFLPYPGSTIAIVFLQPTLWIAALFALHPIHEWLERNAGRWPGLALWAILGLTWVQALLAFNLAHRASFDRDTAEALWQIQRDSAPDDVVAYTQSRLTEEPVWGGPVVSSNFSIMAMTGLDGYYLAENYFIPFAVAGLALRDGSDGVAEAKHLYQQRHEDTEAFIKGAITEQGRARLARDRVRWIVVSGEELGEASNAQNLWRRTGQVVIYQLSH